MSNRGDRGHDIAAWFGVNQGRIKGAKDGKFGVAAPAAARDLPPKGPPGIKGRRLRAAIEKALSLIGAGETKEAEKTLQDARAKYDSNEA
jgi:hypothetical protein